MKSEHAQLAVVKAEAPLADVESEQAATHLHLGGRSIRVADPAMLALYDLVRSLAPTDLPVLIQGETGVGKENAAYALHGWSRRHDGPFVAVNCAAFTESLVESQLFGCERGAYSGAVAARSGLFEAAAGGTIFFDEIGELPRALQPKLLRVLETKRAMRVGGTRERELDVRIVAATNRDLRADAKAGRFREDLLFRLNAATLALPPLRARPREVALLARSFLDDAAARLGLPARSLSGASLHALAAYDWPGNVRELKNVMDFLAATNPGPVIEAGPLCARLGVAVPVERIAATTTLAFRPRPAAVPTQFAVLADELRALERRRMREALDCAHGVQTRAAELISMPLRTFQQKAKQFGLLHREPGRQEVAGAKL
jgi:two-component system response regulator AtoC